ncbi:PQQ-dependent sugar dehydrogenase [Sphingomonas soli]|uniref:PQQ-dependent sugar dehydrogenase n=1 Tax=Sphingomonas soli TaxID=266127 RepID=UPI0008365EF4|nr:PQQ-dependent sugar dehydrogenase [Sphingomonas soli]
MTPARMLLPALALLGACNSSPSAVAQNAAARPFAVTEVADFDSPWAMTFLPDGRMLVTEKKGQLLLVSADGKSSKTVAGTPQVSSAGQGGLMDVVLHPQFAANRLVYLSWSEANAEGLKGVALGRGTLAADGSKLEGFQTIFRAHPYVEGNGHFSGRIAFAPDGHLFFTNGERQKFTPAQDPQATLGKVLRLNDDGTPAKGNPLAAQGFRPDVWSYGHRNLLGLTFDANGNLWEQEMGPKGGDEINLIVAGKNYGYPNVSNGDHYDGKDIPDHKAGDGYEAPKVWWNPSISPGGLMAYSGKLFPEWKGDLFLGGLSGKALIRIDVNGTDAKKGDQWDMGARIREVEEGPDGAIWVLEDGGQGSQGRLLKLTPAK